MRLERFTVEVTRRTQVDVLAVNPEQAEADAIDVANGLPEWCWATEAEVL